MTPNPREGRPNLADPEVFERCTDRLARLDPSSEPAWGEMDAAQMLAHCAEVQEVMNGKSLESTPLLLRLLGPIVKRVVLSSRPFPRGVRTHPQYLVAEPRDFEEQRARLRGAMDEFRSLAQEDRVPVHPVFGKLGPAEAGWASYKHLDHHFTQFGV